MQNFVTLKQKRDVKKGHTAKRKIKIEKTGEDLEIGFNHKFLLDALKASETEEIFLDFSNNLSPCILRGETDEFLYMVLPVRL